MVKIGAIVQARMSSKRLPGKVLRDVLDKPILQYLLERLNHCSVLDEIVVATSMEHSDQPIVDFCEQFGVRCYRGNLDNVAGRFNDLLQEYQFDIFVRLSGDSPLLDQNLVEQGVKVLLKNKADLVTNVLSRTYPKGQSVELLYRDVFQAAYPFMKTPDEMEHVTKYFYNHQERFEIVNFKSGRDCGNIQLSVDTVEDEQMFSAIVHRMNKPHWEYRWDELVFLYQTIGGISW